MNHRPSALYDLVQPGDFDAVRGGEHPFAAGGHGAGSPFDADAWSLLIEEQRALIARAAGVDPSRVRIKIGH